MFKKLLISTLFVFFIFGGIIQAQDSIPIGAIIDKTGKTADVGKWMCQGVEDYFTYVNEHGGVRGKKINLLVRDNHYDVLTSIQQYDELKEKGVLAIIGWGTAESLALVRYVNADNITWLPGSMTETLVEPVKPYNFILTASYEDQFYALLGYAAKHPKVIGRPVKVAFIFNSTPFGKAPIKKGVEMAGQLGLEFVGSEIVELDEPNADKQIEGLILKNPDYIIIQETGPATLAVLNSCKKFGLKSTVMGTFYSGNETIITKAEDALKEVELITASPLGRGYEDVPGMSRIKEFCTTRYPEMKEWPQTYIEGWIMAMLYTEVLNRCGDNLTRENFRNVLESIKDFNPEGLMPTISYSPANHKGTNKVKIYKANIKTKRFDALSEWMK
jgi:branched-chain amino acid transport system substrate-binding protein